MGPQTSPKTHSSLFPLLQGHHFQPPPITQPSCLFLPFPTQGIPGNFNLQRGATLSVCFLRLAHEGLQHLSACYCYRLNYNATPTCTHSNGLAPGLGRGRTSHCRAVSPTPRVSPGPSGAFQTLSILSLSNHTSHLGGDIRYVPVSTLTKDKGHQRTFSFCSPDTPCSPGSPSPTAPICTGLCSNPPAVGLFAQLHS